MDASLARPAGSGHADGQILRDTFGRQRLIVIVENPGDAQIVVQFEKRRQ